MLDTRRRRGKQALTALVTAVTLLLLMGVSPSSAASPAPANTHGTGELMRASNAASHKFHCRPDSMPMLARVQRCGVEVQAVLVKRQRYGNAHRA